MVSLPYVLRCTENMASHGARPGVAHGCPVERTRDSSVPLDQWSISQCLLYVSETCCYGPLCEYRREIQVIFCRSAQALVISRPALNGYIACNRYIRQVE